MASHRITNDLLNITVGIKLENGVSAGQVRHLISEFLPDPRCRKRSNVSGFLWVEDVPENRRAEFLAAVSSLAPQEHGSAPARERTISAADIW